MATSLIQSSMPMSPPGATPPEISLAVDPTLSRARRALRRNSTKAAGSGRGLEKRAKLGSFHSSQAWIAGIAAQRRGEEGLEGLGVGVCPQLAGGAGPARRVGDDRDAASARAASPPRRSRRSGSKRHVRCARSARAPLPSSRAGRCAPTWRRWPRCPRRCARGRPAAAPATDASPRRRSRWRAGHARTAPPQGRARARARWPGESVGGETRHFDHRHCFPGLEFQDHLVNSDRLYGLYATVLRRKPIDKVENESDLDSLTQVADAPCGVGSARARRLRRHLRRHR